VADVPTAFSSHFFRREGELLVGGIPVSRLASHYGTPAFFYDRNVAAKKLRMLRKALPARFAVYYSVKANPNQAILKHFLGSGCGLEVASAGEFHQALSAGCPPQKILFAGPGKTDAELERVLAAGIGEIHSESLREIECVALIGRALGVRARVAIRVNPTAEAAGGAMQMGGRPLPFGVDEECLEAALDRILAEPQIEFQGIHLFAGTQILDCSVLLAQYRKTLEIGARIVKRLGRPLATLDFGGGLGIPYFAHERELDLEQLRVGLAALLGEFDPSLFAPTQFIVEPGRYLIGEAGVYVARVTEIKVSRKKKFLILDGGMNHHLAASGNLGQAIKRNFPVALLSKLDAPAEEAVDLVGPLCTPLDVLARHVALPSASEGDLVGIFQSGAYARAASPLHFLSHPTPPEVWVEEGEDRLIRRRGEFEDDLRDQNVAAAGEKVGCARNREKP
jgi:diaminopimelate decarboxylase